MHRDAPPLRILMVLESNFTKRGGGGAESQLRTIALALKRAGQRVAIVTPLSANGPQSTSERCYGLAVGRVKYPRVRLVGAAIMNLRFAAFLVQNRHRYDAWHVHIGHNMGALACLIGSLVGKPVVVKISGWWELEAGLLAPNRGFF
ncbi:MAG: glycosyltransferase family 4 protein, partial [Polyangia bacterium]